MAVSNTQLSKGLLVVPRLAMEVTAAGMSIEVIFVFLNALPLMVVTVSGSSMLSRPEFRNNCEPMVSILLPSPKVTSVRL